jgi:hypothetical protein
LPKFVFKDIKNSSFDKKYDVLKQLLEVNLPIVVSNDLSEKGRERSKFKDGRTERLVIIF